MHFFPTTIWNLTKKVWKLYANFLAFQRPSEVWTLVARYICRNIQGEKNIRTLCIFVPNDYQKSNEGGVKTLYKFFSSSNNHLKCGYVWLVIELDRKKGGIRTLCKFFSISDMDILPRKMNYTEGKKCVFVDRLIWIYRRTYENWEVQK